MIGDEIPIATKYINDIIGFAEGFLGITLRPRQIESLLAVQEKHRVCVRSPRGYGKTTVSAIVALWALATRQNVKVLTTGPSWDQLLSGLWREIPLWVKAGDWESLGITIRPDKQLTTKQLELHKNRVILAKSPKEPARIEGIHAECVVIIIDEAKIVPQAIWDSLEGTLFGCKEYFYLAISTPGPPIGEFYNIQSKKPGYEKWHSIHITKEDALRDVPLFDESEELMRKKWGVNSVLYKQHVTAEFAEDEESALVPLEWLELANKRWTEKSKIPNTERVLKIVGMDVGGEGASQSVLARMYDDNYISLLEKHSKPDTGANIGYLEVALRESLNSENVFEAVAHVDVIGIGTGVVDISRKEKNLPVIGVNVSNKTKMRDTTGMLTFVNIRAFIGWALREAINPAGDILLAIPPDSDLIGELCALRWEMTGSGIKLESKLRFKQRYGKSPDTADAVMLCMWKRAGVAKVLMADKNPFYG